MVLVTTADGPWSEDLFYVLQSCDDVLVIPNESVCHSDLVGRLVALPGFDESKFFEAVASCEEAEFLCWEAPSRKWAQ